jgi:endonuclease/exonuclease/phosphatase family metal-dependent hydrolase
VRLATWNLQSGRDVASGRVDLPAVARAVTALDVDVLAVQEVDRGLVRSGEVDQVAELARLLGWHGVFAPALAGDPLTRWRPAPVPDDGGPAFGVGLLAREPLEGVAVRALPGGGAGGRASPASGPGWDREPRTVLRAVAAGGRAVTTTHLSYLPWRGLRQLRAALRFAGGGVLLGDLNLPVRVLDAALRGTGWTGHPAGPTFPAWKPGMQLDHVLSRGVAVSGAATGPASTSDHLPLVVTVT